MMVGVPIAPSPGRGSGPETRPGVEPSGRGDVAPTAPQMTDVAPNRCGEPMSPLGEPSPFRAGRRSASP
jgi:hypothetical protein